MAFAYLSRPAAQRVVSPLRQHIAQAHVNFWIEFLLIVISVFISIDHILYQTIFRNLDVCWKKKNKRCLYLRDFILIRCASYIQSQILDMANTHIKLLLM